MDDACGQKDNGSSQGRAREGGGKEEKTQSPAFQNNQINQRQLLLLKMEVVVNSEIRWGITWNLFLSSFLHLIFLF